MIDSSSRRRAAVIALATLLTGILLAGCATASPTGPPSSVESETSAEREVSSLSPRALIAHGGGLTLLDPATGNRLHEEEIGGFLRLNAAGDGQHVMVSDSDVFRVFDAGIRAVPHGEHDHYYESEPELTDITFDAPRAGHVVVHAGFTTLFADGTGGIQTIATAQIGQPDAVIYQAVTETPHHGVALRLENGNLLTTQGTEDERRTVQVREGESIVASTDDCPGVHGEAAAKPGPGGDVVVLGCENGPVIFRDGVFHKVAVEDPYARSGNLAGHRESSVVLGDYKVDPRADHEHPTRVSLIDTADASIQLVDLGSTYWFRSLARGGNGEALVLTADGSVRVIDPESGEETARIEAMGAWAEPEDWQQPGPVLKAAGRDVYVLDPAANELITINIDTRAVTARVDVPEDAVELAVVTGFADH